MLLPSVGRSLADDPISKQRRRRSLLAKCWEVNFVPKMGVLSNLWVFFRREDVGKFPSVGVIFIPKMGVLSNLWVFFRREDVGKFV